ncbi:legume lectins beta domain protein [Enterococcus casseliflavus]|uniref:lectin-like domain-containing protein n=1 Tax=Enterococcus casseliflavus TaxID=37734 RepID=UPI002DBB6201|nr:legume lectins beta domain protein [Enterococcus casseliflavus]MEB8398396.1 legume lectins beta domain protein [Enterococcus casseliflavus]
MKKFLTTRFLLFFLLGIALCYKGNASVAATVVEPDFATLPIDETLITTVGQAGSPQGSDGYNYVQINDGVTSNVSGGVWFNKAVSFTRSFRLEMAFCIENAAADSDGLAFVMQSSGLNALAQQAGPTIGVWSNSGGATPLSTGAIPQSFAIEFDTFYNNAGLTGDGMMDRDVPSGHHIAWNFPGSNDAYTTDGWLIIDKVLNHRDTVSVPDISDGQWHIFTVVFDQPTQTLRYTVPDFGVDVTVPVDDTFKSNLNLTNSAPVYFGFTGANGGYVQEKAVAFVDVEGLVELDMRTGVFEKDPVKLLLDTGTTLAQPATVDNSKTITYATYLSYKSTSDLADLESGILLSSLFPEGLSLVPEAVYFGKASEIMVNGMPEGGTALPFAIENGQLVVTLPDMVKGNEYIVHFSVNYTEAPLDQNLDVAIPVQTVFNGNAFVSSMTSGDPEIHYYQMTGSFPPTLSTGSASLAEAKADLQIVRQKRNSYIPITIDDQNSTQAKIYVTDFFTEDKTITETDFSEAALVERGTLSEPLSDTLALETSDLEPGTTYYLASYVIDTEGNRSATRYYGIDFRGIVVFERAPASINAAALTLNELARTIRDDGFAYLTIAFDQEALLSVSNTSEGTWQLSGQMTDFMQNQQQLADEIQLVLYDPVTNQLVASVTSEEQVIFQQQPTGAKDLTLDLQEYDCYFRFVPKLDLIEPGTYSGTVNWQLESTIVD